MRALAVEDDPRIAGDLHAAEAGAAEREVAERDGRALHRDAVARGVVLAVAGGAVARQGVGHGDVLRGHRGALEGEEARRAGALDMDPGEGRGRSAADLDPTAEQAGAHRVGVSHLDVLRRDLDVHGEQARAVRVGDGQPPQRVAALSIAMTPRESV